MKIWKYFILFCCINLVFPVIADNTDYECDGPYKRIRITSEQLKEILEQHEALLKETKYQLAEHDYKDSRYANLCGADLFIADLAGANLAGANLAGAILAGANLVEANLVGANLVQTNLTGAELYKANLTRANLMGAKLTEAELIGANLTEANLLKAELYEVDLSHANLTKVKSDSKNLGINKSLCKNNYTEQRISDEKLKEILKQHQELLIEKKYNLTRKDFEDSRYANLCKTNLVKANLVEADLRGANLSEANLTEADLRGANLAKAELYKANFTQANLRKAILIDSKLFKANLKETNLIGANLQQAYLRMANLKKSDLRKANLSGANLFKSDLSDANLSGTNLSGANLSGANLSDADLSTANLEKANLIMAYLKNSYFLGVNLNKTLFLPKGDGLPEPISFSTTNNLLYSHYYDPKYGAPVIQKLLSDYKRLGMRQMERLLTYMIKKEQRKADMAKEWGWEKMGAITNLILFEYPSKYGYEPQRALTRLVLCIFIFSFFYWLGLKRGMQIELVWEPILLSSKKKGLRTKVKRPYVYYTVRLNNPHQSWWYSELKLIRLAFHISINSAFKIGWKGLDFGTWMKKLQKREYHLETPNSWIKSICTIQSLLGIYLVALWFATQFGRPFDY